MKIVRTQHGFTLIEMMIVIGIIALLAALTLGISSSVMRNAEKRKTQDVLQLLTVALQEWELEKGNVFPLNTTTLYDYEKHYVLCC